MTKRCNARCTMCDSWRWPRTGELTPEEVYTLFRQLGRLDVVRLSGGEPFMRPDLGSLALAVEEASRPVILHLTTNGSFPEAAEHLAASFPRPRALFFLVSVDGWRQVHDANRGPAVSFAKVEDTVRRLVRLRTLRGVRVAVNHTVISPQSLADAPVVQRFFAQWEVPVSTVVAYADSATYTLARNREQRQNFGPGPAYPLYPSLRRETVARFVAAERNAVRAQPDVLWRLWRGYYLEGLARRLAEVPSADPNPRCAALRYHLRIEPDGTVPVCQFNGTVVGNLRQRAPLEVLASPEAEAARRWVDACPGCWAECEVLPNALYSGELGRLRRWVRALAGGSQARENPVEELCGEHP